MTSFDEYYKARLKKLETIRKAGINPYPAQSKRNYNCFQARHDFNKLKKAITLAGRLMSLREHGKLTFANLQDETGKFQLAFKEDLLKKDYDFLKKLDLGDFIEVTGKCFKTKLGEKTLAVEKLVLLAKSLRPLPEKWHGLKDVELRYRKRYLDLIMNEKTRRVFYLRSQMIDAIRDFLTDRNFLEVETPILQATPGGAVAKPFVTHHNALNTDFYLRIAPELYLKRLIVGGFEKVFEISRNFRNEGISTVHNPDFTMLEFYWAYKDYNALMELTEELFTYLLQRLKLETKIKYQGKQVDFKTPWKKITFTDLLREKAGLDITKFNTREELLPFAEKLEVNITPEMGADKIIDEIFKKKIRPQIINPLFVINQPLFLSPLAKKRMKNEKEVERYQLIIGGLEIVNAYSELNDPIDQRGRFEEQQKLRKMGDEEAHPLDEDYIEALEYGMPPTAGFGLGIDRLVMILANCSNIRDVILFPVLKPKGAVLTDKGGKGRVMLREEALILLKRNLKNANLFKHTLAVEACMKEIAKDKGVNKEVYGLAGILHDLDYEQTKKTPCKHTLETAAILEKEGVRDDIIQAIKAHNEACGGVCESQMDYALRAVDPTTGLIVAATLVLPDKKLKSLTVEFILKKFKSKSFAVGCDRNQIKSCEKLGYTIEDFFALCLKAMQRIDKELGL